MLGRDATRGIVGASPAIEAVRLRAEQIAAWPDPVLILGETGTGKELVARAIHAASRRHGAFVPVNMGGIEAPLFESELFGHERGAFTGADGATPGCFGQAQGGTLFLDEIGDLPLAVQPKLLRALDQHEVRPVGAARPRRIDVRIVAATNVDLAARVASGAFRQDLYHRLNGTSIALPPLRERGPDDVRLLIEHYLPRLASTRGVSVTRVSREAMVALLAYAWPGNVREVMHVLTHALVSVSGGVIQVGDLPDEVRRVPAGAAPASGAPRSPESQRLAGVVARAEGDHVRGVLEATEWNRDRAARMLGISVRSLYDKIRRHGLRPAGRG